MRDVVRYSRADITKRAIKLFTENHNGHFNPRAVDRDLLDHVRAEDTAWTIIHVLFPPRVQDVRGRKGHAMIKMSPRSTWRIRNLNMSRSGCPRLAHDGESAISSQYKCLTLIYFTLFPRLSTRSPRASKRAGGKKTRDVRDARERTRINPNGNVSVREISLRGGSEIGQKGGARRPPCRATTDVMKPSEN